MVPVSILFGALLTVTAATAIGCSLLRGIGVRLYRGEELPLAFVTGSAVLSSITFLLASLHWATRGAFLGVAALALAQAFLPVWRSAKPRPRFTPLPRHWTALFAACFGVFTVLYFFSAMAPEFSPDGTSYHLSFVIKYLRAHGFVFIPTNIYAQLSQGIELLYLFAFAFGHHSAAALVHYAFLLALAVLIVNYGRRTGHPIAGLCGAGLTYASPVAGMDGTTAYIDVAVAAILFAVFYLVQLWDEQRGTGLLVLLGLTAGFGYAAKYTAGLAILYAAGYVLWRTRKLKPVLLVGACSLVLVLPWIIKNALWTGDPFSPMFNRYFPNPYVRIVFEDYWKYYLRTYYLPSLWSIPFEVLVRGEKLCGLIGPVFFLAPLCLYGLRTREGRRVLAAGAVFTIPYFFNIGTRFLIPALPFYAFTLALVLSDMRLLLGAAVVLHSILSWPSIAIHYTDLHPWILQRVPFKQALRIESEDSWLSRKQPFYKVAKLFQQKVPRDAHVLSFTAVPESYISADILVAYQSAFGERLADMFYAAFNADYQPRSAEWVRFPPHRVQKIRVYQTREWKMEWTIAEMRLFSAARELRRSPEWRLTANPNPWDIQLAFDNNPVTRWRCGEPTRPGMWVEVDLGRPQLVDAVELESPTDSGHRDLRVEGAGADGRWTVLGTVRTIDWLNPAQFMGKAAMRELKWRGIDYLYLTESDFGYPEVAENPPAWGLTEVGTAIGGHLYRIDAGLPELEPAEPVQ